MRKMALFAYNPTRPAIWNDRFPQPMTIEFLLLRHLAGQTEALKPALHALQAMALGGKYDVIGGGFSRYSTDNDWCVPHFEKMLYDNAQLARVYLHAWQVSGSNSTKATSTSAGSWKPMNWPGKCSNISSIRLAAFLIQPGMPKHC